MSYNKDLTPHSLEPQVRFIAMNIDEYPGLK